MQTSDAHPFHIDADRVDVTGLSLGGRRPLARPDPANRWVAIAPVCPTGPAGIGHLAPNALNLPVRLFHGVPDRVVPVGLSGPWYQRLSQLGIPIAYVEDADVHHHGWDHA